MKTKLILVMLLISISMHSQKTIVNRNYLGQIYEQYDTNANGDMHGTYKKFNRQGRVTTVANYVNGTLHGSYIDYFDNGVIKLDAKYHNGIRIRSKVYMHNANQTKRFLVIDHTYANDGTPIKLRERILTYDKDEPTEWVEWPYE